MASLEKLAHLDISFKGVFYSDGFHSTRFFSKIDDVILNEQTKKIFIRFNQQYVHMLKESKFFRNIDYNEYKRLKRPSSKRLYEILSKTFFDRDEWAIGIQALAEKMAADKRKDAKIIPLNCCPYHAGHN